MRFVWVVLLAAMVGCSVKLTGAPCSGHENCPLDQRCDFTSNQCVLCESDPDCEGTTKGDFCSSDGKSVKDCYQNAGSCFYSLARETCGDNLSCGTRAGSPTCECSANSGSTFYVDTSGSGSGAAPFPSGLSSPAECRYKSISDALVSAKEYIVTYGLASVVLVGDGQTAQTFGDSETFPLTVTNGVTVATEPANRPELFLLDFDGASVSPAMRVQNGATVAGITLRNIDSAGAVGTSGTALAVDCASAGSVAVQSLDVRGGATGIAVGLDTGVACDVSMTGVSVTGATVGVDVGGSAVIAELHGVTVSGCGDGISVDGGASVVLDQGSALLDNSSNGLEVVKGAATLAGTSDALLEIGGNGQTGIWMGIDSNTASGVSLAVSYANIHDNGASASSGGAGIVVNNADDSGYGGSIAIGESTFTANAEAGLIVRRSASLGGSYSTTVNGCTFTGGTYGIELTTERQIWASLQGNVVSGAVETGLLVNATTDSSIAIVSNEITGNLAATGLSWGRKAGGIIFSNAPPTLVFQGNQVYKNTGSQILFSSSSTSTWNLGGGDCSTLRNQICGYDATSSTYGMVLSLGSDGATVNAGNTSWYNSAPGSTVDYYLVKGSLNTTSPCARTTLCD